MNTTSMKTRLKKMEPFFPSFELQLRNEPKKILYFHGESDVVTSYLTYIDCQSNSAISGYHNNYRAQFRSKIGMTPGSTKANYDWKADPCKLSPLKNTLEIVPADTDFIMLDFNKIKKIRQKIENVIAKY